MGFGYYYDCVYMIKTDRQRYYLAVYNAEYSTQAFGTGVKVFAIENGKLNSDVKIIKTATGLHNEIGYDFNVFSSSSIDGKHPKIYYDDNLKTLYIPLLSEKERFTVKFITYKITGQYFEKVK